jgi:hypothetical protein
MLFSIVTALVRNLIKVPAAALGTGVARDVELLALRHENEVLHCQIARVRYEPVDRIFRGWSCGSAGGWFSRSSLPRAALASGTRYVEMDVPSASLPRQAVRPRPPSSGSSCAWSKRTVRGGSAGYRVNSRVLATGRPVHGLADDARREH